jgi:hypothetical protein
MQMSARPVEKALDESRLSSSPSAPGFTLCKLQEMPMSARSTRGLSKMWSMSTCACSNSLLRLERRALAACS